MSDTTNTPTNTQFVCPRDQQPLTRNQQLQTYECATCDGELIGIAVLRRLVDTTAINQLWQAAKTDKFTDGPSCPGGTHQLREVTLTTNDNPDLLADVVLDVCPTCHHVWADPGEPDVLPPNLQAAQDDSNEPDGFTMTSHHRRQSHERRQRVLDAATQPVTGFSVFTHGLAATIDLISEIALWTMFDD